MNIKELVTVERVRQGAKMVGVPIVSGSFVVSDEEQICGICPLTAAYVAHQNPAYCSGPSLRNQATGWLTINIGSNNMRAFWMTFDKAAFVTTREGDAVETAKIIRKAYDENLLPRP